MKRILYAIAALVCLAGCSDRMPIGHEIASSVYLLHAGENQCRITSETEYLNVWICKSGYDSKTYSFDAEIDIEDLARYSVKYKKNYQMLPANAYTLATPSITMKPEEFKTAVRIDIDPSCITKGVTFILPVRVTCTDPDSFKGEDTEYLIINK